MLNRNLPIPLYYQAKNILQTWILEGKFDIDKPITPEAKLAELMGIHRLTVRRALTQLVYEGTLVRYPGKGTFIVSKAKDVIKRGDDPYELFGFAGAFAPKSKTTFVEINEIPVSDLIANRLNLSSDKRQAIEIKRIRSLKGEPYIYVKNYLPLEIGRKISREMLLKFQLQAILEQIGVHFKKAIQTLQAVASDQEVSQTLNIPLASPIFNVERILFSEQGVPIVFSLLNYLGNKFKFTMKFRKTKGNSPYGWTIES